MNTSNKWNTGVTMTIFFCSKNQRQGHKEGIIQGGNNMLYELVQDGSISIDVASKKMGGSKKEFENKMNLCGYKQPKQA